MLPLMKHATWACALITEALRALMYPSSTEAAHLPSFLHTSGGTPATSAQVLMVARSECSENCAPAPASMSLTPTSLPRDSLSIPKSICEACTASWYLAMCGTMPSRLPLGLARK